MRIIVENSDMDSKRKQMMGQVDWALRDLTANLIRVTRGAGNPSEIGRHAMELVNAITEYRDSVGYFPSSEALSKALSIEILSQAMSGISDVKLEEVLAEQRIIRGALQIVASSLVDQKTQESNGYNEMFDGLRQFEKIRAEKRKKYE